MSKTNYYDTCKKGIGRCVQLTMRDGSVHRGIIDRVTPSRVYLRPIGGSRNYRGYGFGWGWGFGAAAAGFAIGAIAALAFIPFFW